MACTAVFWAITLLAQPATRRLALRGVALALLVALALALVVFALAMVFLRTSSADAAQAGATVGLAYLWLNLVVLGVGLWFKPAQSWALGAALATPVVVAAIGFGYAAYRAWPL